MNVLYIGKSRVIQDILDNISKESDIILYTDNNKIDDIDIIFADLDYIELDEIIDIYSKDKIIAIISSSDKIVDGIYTLQKPFLEKDVLEAISKLNIDKDISDTNETEVLRLEEIQRVKELLKETENISNKETSLDSIYELNRDDSIVYNITVDELINILDRVKTKRLRKLLKGAVVDISIKFPKD